MFLGMWELIFSHVFEPFAHIMLWNEGTFVIGSERRLEISLLLMQLNLFCSCLVPSWTCFSIALLATLLVLSSDFALMQILHECCTSCVCVSCIKTLVCGERELKVEAYYVHPTSLRLEFDSHHPHPPSTKT